MEKILNIYDIKRHISAKNFKSAVDYSSTQNSEISVKYNKDLLFYQITSKFNDNGKNVEVFVNLKENPQYNLYEIKDSGCSCIESDRCKHVGSLLITLSGYSVKELMLLIEQKGEGKKDSTTKELLVLEQKILDKYSNVDKNKELRYTLHPIVLFNKGKIFLEFKIGHVNSHLYSITDVYEFYQRFETSETYEYSAKFSCTHKLRYIEEKIPGLNDFLFAKIKNNKNIIQSLDVYNNTKNTRFSYDKRYVEITENDFGILFNFLLEGIIHVKYLKDKKLHENKLICEYDELNIYLNIKKGTKYYNISAVNDTVYTYYGDNYIISIIDDRLKVTKIKNTDDARFLNLILQKNLKIGINEFDRIYDNVLKERLKFIKLVKDCNFSEDSIESVQLHIFIDVNKNGHLVIKKKLFRKNLEIKSNDQDLLKRRNVLALDDILAKHKEKDRYIVKDISDIFDFYNETLDEISSIADKIFLSEEFKQVKIVEKPVIKTGIKIENDLLKLNIEIEDEKIEELKRLLTDYQEKKKYFQLQNGDFLSLESDEFKSLFDVINNINTKKVDVKDGEIILNKYTAAYVDDILSNSNLKYVKSDDNYKELITNIKDSDKLDFVVPELNNVTLRDYQVEGYKFLKTMQQNHFGVILADDMGLGKTIQIITTLLTIEPTHLVVCPSSLVYNWVNEINTFAPSLKVGIVKNDKNTRCKVIKNYKDYDVLITSYDTLKRDIALYDEVSISAVVIDEAQYIKNPNTKGAQVIKKLNAQHKFALTGTPIENNLTELWSLFDFILPGYLSSYYKFYKNYEIPIVKYRDDRILDELRTLVSPFILRRMKKDVLTELPEKMESVVYCEFDQKQQDIYDSYVLKIREDIKEKTDEDYSKNKIEILSMLMKLRQICCDPRLLFEDEDIPSAKLNLALELIQNSVQAGRKILLFSQYTSMLDIISKNLDELNIKHHLLTGKLSSKKRMTMVEEFNNDDSDVFLISLKAGGTGLNLTKADVVIHYDPWWNISSENQATDRAYRIGQKNKVNVYKLIAKDTIEEKIVKIQEKKKELSNSIIKENTNPFTQFTKDEFLDIFE